MPDNSEQSYFAYSTDEIVVDLPFADLVCQELPKIGPGRGDVVARHEELRLALVKVINVNEIAAEIPGFYESSIDAVLAELRHRFGAWSLPVGKNRTIYGVQGAPHIGTGVPGAASGYPKPEPTSRATDWSPSTVAQADRVRVGLIDTPVAESSVFDGHVKRLDNVTIPTATAYPHLLGHGTFTAGLIFKEAPDIELVAQGVLDAAAVSTVWKVATAMAEFRSIANLSVVVLPLACYTTDNEAPLALQRAVDYLREYVPIVVAAGNHGGPPLPGRISLFKRPAFPAACSGVVAVGALSPEYDRAEFSPELPWVQGAAFGADVTSTFLTGSVQFQEMGDPKQRAPEDKAFEGFAEWSGTSFAAATFAGAVAAKGQFGKEAFAVVDQLLTQNPVDHKGIGEYLYRGL